MIPQKIEKKSYSTFYTAAVKLKENTKKSHGKNLKKNLSVFGGKDGIYAPAQLLCDEPIIKRLKNWKMF